MAALNTGGIQDRIRMLKWQRLMPLIPEPKPKAPKKDDGDVFHWMDMYDAPFGIIPPAPKIECVKEEPSPMKKEPEKPKEKVIFTKRKYDLSTEWLSYGDFSHVDMAYYTVTVAPLITGCGIGQITDVGGLCDTARGTAILRDILDAVIKKYNASPENSHRGAGLLIATLGHYQRRGESGRRLVKNLKSLGFKLISKYNNWRHDEREIQSLYGYKLPLYRTLKAQREREKETEKQLDIAL